MFTRADGDARAQEAGPEVPARSTTCRACARCSWPASRSTSRPRAGSPRRSASRSSTTTGRPRAAGRSSPSPTAWRRCRASSAARACRCTATTCLVDEATGAEITEPDEKGVVVIEGPTPPGFMQTVWRDDERFVETYWTTIPGRQGLQHLRLGHPRRGRLLLHPRPHRRRHQRRRPPPRHARDRGEHLEPCRTSPRSPSSASPTRSRARSRWRSWSPRTPRALGDAAARLRLEGEIMKTVDDQLGAVARPARVHFVTVLPKTRSRQAAAPRDPGDLRGPRPRRPDDDRGPGGAAADPRADRAGARLEERAGRGRAAPPGR